MSETLDLSRLEATLSLGNQASQVPGIPETGVLSGERGDSGAGAPRGFSLGHIFQLIQRYLHEVPVTMGDFYLSISNLLFEATSFSHPALEAPAKGVAVPARPVPEARFRPKKLECVALLQHHMSASVSRSNRSHAVSLLGICLWAIQTSPEASFACLKSIISSQRAPFWRRRAQPPLGAASP